VSNFFYIINLLLFTSYAPFVHLVQLQHNNSAIGQQYHNSVVRYNGKVVQHFSCTTGGVMPSTMLLYRSGVRASFRLSQIHSWYCVKTREAPIV